jgi:hypothetical protein
LAADLCGVKTRAVANLVLGDVVSLLSWGQSQETADNLHPNVFGVLSGGKARDR